MLMISGTEFISEAGARFSRTIPSAEKAGKIISQQSLQGSVERVEFGQTPFKNATYDERLKIGLPGELVSRLRDFVAEALEEQLEAEASGDLGEGGYFDAQPTADRVSGFAIALAGDEPDGYDRVMEAYLGALLRVQSARAQELPPIFYRTLDSIEARIEEWRGGFLPPMG